MLEINQIASNDPFYGSSHTPLLLLTTNPQKIVFTHKKESLAHYQWGFKKAFFLNDMVSVLTNWKTSLQRAQINCFQVFNINIE
jgi:hypothetical protein